MAATSNKIIIFIFSIILLIFTNKLAMAALTQQGQGDSGLASGGYHPPRGRSPHGPQRGGFQPDGHGCHPHKKCHPPKDHHE
ncbi:hypothetical protein IHE45_19G070700 [Dioscorea alata]|uniref:Uncharacterized protein n=1 Tax=Dioscorea alata TaxID=55571 RepID=A0ACB7TYZ4_DIOAL|nr:hypothetical protein IHE45_19G070700 [Dioscorea alata]